MAQDGPRLLHMQKTLRKTSYRKTTKMVRLIAGLQIKKIQRRLIIWVAVFQINVFYASRTEQWKSLQRWQLARAHRSQASQLRYLVQKEVLPVRATPTSRPVHRLLSRSRNWTWVGLSCLMCTAPSTQISHKPSLRQWMDLIHTAFQTMINPFLLLLSYPAKNSAGWLMLFANI